MKVLLDENLDHRLRNHLGKHEVFTVSYMGWKEVKNGNLVQMAEDEGFDVLITGDQSLYHEQNWTGRRLAILVLSSVEWHITKASSCPHRRSVGVRRAGILPGCRVRDLRPKVAFQSVCTERR